MLRFSLMVLALAALLLRAAWAGTINICANVAHDGGPAADVQVTCWDYDPVDNDDFMASGVLDDNGCVSLNYARLEYPWYRCHRRWDGCANNRPDIYCQLGAPGDCVTPKTTATRNNQNSGGTTDFGTLTVTANTDFCSTDASFNGCGARALMPTWLVEMANDVTQFQEECNFHDVCLASCEYTLSYCNDVFRNDVRDKCDQVGGGGFWCDFLAEAFIALVDASGRAFCRSGRQGDCNAEEVDLCDE